MRTHLLLLPVALLAASASAHAIDVSHRTTGDKQSAQNTQMAWRYRTLAAGLDVFEREALALAPQATLAFALPKPDGAEGENKVVLERPGDPIALPMVGLASFAMVRDQKALESDARVVTNRQFRPGVVNHPNVQVRSPSLAADTRRLGDLRLACEVQMAMARTESTGLRAMLAAVSLFKGTLCGAVKVTHIDAPAGAFESIVIDDGKRRVVQKTSGPDGATVTLGDAIWGHDTRIQFMPAGQ